MRVLAALLLVACATDQSGRPPVARIEATPRAIPEGDAFMTDVLLDGSTSADPIDDPEGTQPLGFRWRVLDDEARFVGGDERSPMATIRLAGARPARVELTVTDSEGDAGVDLLALQVTVP